MSNILQRSQEMGVDFLQAHVNSNGKIHGRCEGRPLETALALHLLQDTHLLEEEQKRLFAFCQSYWRAHSVWRSTDTPIDLNNLLSHIVIFKMLDQSSPEGLPATFKQIVAAFNHSSTERKHILFSILLAELQIIPFHDLKFDVTSFHSSSNQSANQGLPGRKTMSIVTSWRQPGTSSVLIRQWAGVAVKRCCGVGSQMQPRRTTPTPTDMCLLTG